MASIAQTGRPIYYWSGSAWLPISSTIGDFETIQDVTADMFTSHGLHENISVTYDDSTGRMILSADGAVTSVNTQVGDVVLDTDDVLEANNLYFTSQRAIDATSSIINSASAQTLFEANYYSESAINSASPTIVVTASAAAAGYADSAINALTTTDIEEGTNLYYTDERAIVAASAIQLTASAVNVTSSVQYLDQLIQDLENAIGPASASATATRLVTYVKNVTGSQINKGQPVYISGATGNAISVSLASNSQESTSSKTFGLAQNDIPHDNFGYIVTEGLLQSIDTSLANAGDPVWLGPTPGSIIYGLVNKPIAPNHLVFLGVVERVQQNNGSMYVKVQNGFEIHELHDVRAIDEQDGDILLYNGASSLYINTPLTTDIVPEGSNLYFTDARVENAASALFVHPNHQNISASLVNNQIILSSSASGGGGGASLIVSDTAPTGAVEGDGWFESDTGTFYVYDGTYWIEVSTNVSINAESAQDAIAPLLNHGFHENITATYNDASNRIILSASAGGGVGNVISVNGQEGVIVLTTSNIAEGTNRYFTNQRAIDAASAVYLSDATASTKYLEQTNAASTYVTQSNANTLYAPKNSPAFTGVPQAPTAGTSTSTTQIATTAYVKNQAYLTTANASSTYLTQIDADNIYQTKADGITGVNASAAFYAKTGGPISGNMSVSGSANVTGNVTIGGNLTVSGSSTIINAETIQLADNTIVLNSNVTGVPTENAGIEIERGDLNNVSIRWNESNDYWEYTTDGTIYRALGGGAVQYAPGDPSLTDPNILTGTVWVESDVTGSAINVNDYLTKVDASATYLTQVGASSTYVDFTDTRLVKYGSTQPSNPDTGTVWIDSTNITSPITKVYNGTTWIIASGADTGFHPFFTAGI